MTIKPIMRLAQPWSTRSWGLTVRLILYILLVAAIPVVLTGFLTFGAGRAGIHRHTEMHLASVATIKAQEVERWFRPLRASAEVLAQSQRLRQQVTMLVENPGSPEAADAQAALQASLEDLVRRHHDLQQATAATPSGVILAQTTVPGVAESFAHMEHRHTGEGITISLPPYAPEASPPPLEIVVPLSGADGLPFAYVEMLVSPISLYETLSSDAGLGANGKVYLIDRAGEALTPTALTAAEGPAQSDPALWASGATAATGIQYPDFLGQRVVGAYQALPQLGWSMVAELPADEAFADVTTMRWAIIATSLSMLALLLGVAFLVTRRVTRPLRLLTEGAEKVGMGDLSHRIPVKAASDEVGMLAQTFNQMAQGLQDTQKRAVEAERAAALQAFTESKVEQLKQLSQWGLRIAAAASLERLMELAPAAAQDITRADLATLVVLRQGTREVEATGSAGSSQRDLADQLTRHGDFLAAQLGKTGTQLNGTGAAAPGAVALASLDLGSALAAPLPAEDGSLAGFLAVAQLTDDHTIPLDEQERLQIVASYVAAALQKLRKQESLRVSQQEAVQALAELRRAEQQLIQSQKMESVGRLAGGVAHDFNNLLTPIMGYAQLGVMSLPASSPARGYLQEIQNAGERASNLTRQLLAFSRRQMIEPKVINLNEQIVSMDKLFQRVIGEDIDLLTLPDASLGAVKADPGQIEQVLMNLVVNARDAMPQGGKITIATQNVTLDQAYARRHHDASTGPHVLLSVSDTGSGMPDDVKSHIFEPFFTTKGPGKGTGLGLATCYGIVRQSDGHIEVYSELGRGTTFKIYLPRVDEPVSREAAPDDQSAVPGGAETVLLAEDDQAVRELAARALREKGYAVLAAVNGLEALQIAQNHTGVPIRLLLTDVVMPYMGGKELSDRLRASQPNLRIIFTSGYPDEAVVRHGVLEQGLDFIQKPFTPVALLRKVRQALDRAEAPTEAAAR